MVRWRNVASVASVAKQAYLSDAPQVRADMSECHQHVTLRCNIGRLKGAAQHLQLTRGCTLELANAGVHEFLHQLGGLDGLHVGSPFVRPAAHVAVDHRPHIVPNLVQVNAQRRRNHACGIGMREGVPVKRQRLHAASGSGECGGGHYCRTVARRLPGVQWGELGNAAANTSVEQGWNMLVTHGGDVCWAVKHRNGGQANLCRKAALPLKLRFACGVAGRGQRDH